MTLGFLPLPHRLERDRPRGGLGCDASADFLADGGGGDAVGRVVGFLKGAAADCLVDRLPHRFGDRVGVEDHSGVDVACRPADGLHQRRLASQKAFLVGVENGDERHLRQVEPLAEQVHAHQHVERPLTQRLQQLHPLEGVEFAVEPAAADLPLLEVGRQVFGKLLGQCRDQDTVPCRHRLLDLPLEMRHLLPGRHDFDHRIEQAGGPDHLFHHFAAGAIELPCAGRGRHIDRLVDLLFPLLEHQRTVVEGAGQPKSVLDERQLPAAIPRVHAADLGHGDMGFIDEEKKLLREVVEQRFGRAARGPTAQRPRVVFDAGAESRLHQHLDVKPCPRREPLRLEQLSLRLQLLEPALQFPFDLSDRRADPVFRHHEVPGRIEVGFILLRGHLAAGGMRDSDRLHAVAPEFDAGGQFVVRGPDVDRVAPHAEFPAFERDVVSLVLDRNELLEQAVARQRHAAGQPDDHRPVIVRRAEAVDARHAGHHDHVLAAHQRARRRQSEAVDLLVDRGILLDEDVALRNVGLGLVVVVVADEVVDGVVWEEVAKLGVELGSQRLVVGEHERRPADLRDHVGHRERLAGAGHTHQHL